MQLENLIPRGGMRGGQCSPDSQTGSAAPHTDPAVPEGRLGHRFSGTQKGSVEAATTNTDPGSAGRESGQGGPDIHTSCAALANDPPQGGAGEGQSGCDTQNGFASPAEARKPRGKRSGVDLSRCDDQSTIVDPATISEIGGDAEGRVGHRTGDIHRTRADAATQLRSDAEGGVDHSRLETHSSSVDPAIIDEIREQWRRRQAWHRAEKSLTLQAKALCRRLATDGDKDEADVIYRAAQGDGSHEMADIALAATFPLTEARDRVERHRKAVESRLRKLAKRLPIAPWVEAIPGASLNTLAAVVGEAGDIGAFPYTNPAKLWKRMGLAVMPDGTRQQKRDGDGYAPGRRSVVWNIGGSLIGGMARGPRLEPGQAVEDVEGLSDLQRIFVRRIRYEAERNPDHARPVTKTGKESFSKHAAARAKRYVEKRFLLLMWKEWRRPSLDVSSNDDLAAAEPFREAA